MQAFARAVPRFLAECIRRRALLSKWNESGKEAGTSLVILVIRILDFLSGAPDEETTAPPQLRSDAFLYYAPVAEYNGGDWRRALEVMNCSERSSLAIDREREAILDAIRARWVRYVLPRSTMPKRADWKDAGRRAYFEAAGLLALHEARVVCRALKVSETLFPTAVEAELDKIAATLRALLLSLLPPESTPDNAQVVPGVDVRALASPFFAIESMLDWRPCDGAGHAAIAQGYPADRPSSLFQSIQAPSKSRHHRGGPLWRTSKVRFLLGLDARQPQHMPPGTPVLHSTVVFKMLDMYFQGKTGLSLQRIATVMPGSWPKNGAQAMKETRPLLVAVRGQWLLAIRGRAFGPPRDLLHIIPLWLSAIRYAHNKRMVIASRNQQWRLDQAFASNTSWSYRNLTLSEENWKLACGA